MRAGFVNGVAAVVMATAMLALAAGTARGAADEPPAADPLQSDECRAAMAALQREQQAAASAAAAPRAGLDAARRTAARTCLASRPDAPIEPVAPTTNRLREPVTVPPVGATLRPAPGGAATPNVPAGTAVAPAMPPPVPAPPRPRTITSCDAAGCWVNDGTRVQRQGGTLSGPRGVCTVQGAVVNCP